MLSFQAFGTGLVGIDEELFFSSQDKPCSLLMVSYKLVQRVEAFERKIDALSLTTYDSLGDHSSPQSLITLRGK